MYSGRWTEKSAGKKSPAVRNYTNYLLTQSLELRLSDTKVELVVSTPLSIWPVTDFKAISKCAPQMIHKDAKCRDLLIKWARNELLRVRGNVRGGQTKLEFRLIHRQSHASGWNFSMLKLFVLFAKKICTEKIDNSTRESANLREVLIEVNIAVARIEISHDWLCRELI